LQEKPQLVPLQVAVAFAGAVHGVHEEPQFAVLLFETHCPEHEWYPELHWHSWVETLHVPGCGHCPSSAQPALHCPLARSQ
jgi:hypothetical protein